jgi:hypothetical protein
VLASDPMWPGNESFLFDGTYIRPSLRPESSSPRLRVELGPRGRECFACARGGEDRELHAPRRIARSFPQSLEERGHLLIRHRREVAELAAPCPLARLAANRRGRVVRP